LKVAVANDVAGATPANSTRGPLRRSVESRLKRNPYGTVAGALGIGFVLGGGLFTRLSAKLLGAGLRVALMAALPILERQIVQVVTGSKPNNAKEN
jgi:hypothetical protein